MYGGHTFDWPLPGVTKTAIIWASNPAESHPIQAWRQVLEARRKGTKVIVIDPRRSETVEEAADIWLQLRPGTDGTLAWGLVNVIVEEGLYDKDFVNRWCLGFDRIANLSRRYPPKTVEEITWVPADEIRHVARLFATSKPSLITWSCATAHLGRDATLFAEQGKAVLRAITGNLDVVGGNQIGRHFEKLAWVENLHWDNLIDHPLRKRDNLSAEDFPIASV
jgi:anaerobic selenocysteine-containing dehydrogenase